MPPEIENSKASDTSVDPSSDNPTNPIESKQASHFVQQVWEAPILPPKIFNEYSPEAQKQMLECMAKEQAQRHYDRKQTNWFTFVILLVLAVGGVFLAYHGKGLGTFLSGSMVLFIFYQALKDKIGKIFKRPKS